MSKKQKDIDFRTPARMFTETGPRGGGPALTAGPWALVESGPRLPSEKSVAAKAPAAEAAAEAAARTLLFL